MAERDQYGSPDLPPDMAHDMAPGMLVPENLRDPEQLSQVLQDAGWMLDGQRRNEYQRFVPPFQDARLGNSLLVPLDPDAPEFAERMDAAHKQLNRYGHISERLRAAVADIYAATSQGEQQPYSEAELAELQELYDPEWERALATYMEGPNSGSLFASGHRWNRTESTEGERLARLPETIQAAQEMATAEQRRAVVAYQDASIAEGKIRHLFGELGEGLSTTSREDAEITRLSTDLHELRGYLAAALAPPLDVDGEHGVRMVLDQIADACTDLHDAIEHCTVERHRRANDLAGQAQAVAGDDAVPASDHAQALHKAIHDWASSRHAQTEADTGQAWALLCHYALQAHEAKAPAADTASTATDSHQAPDRQLPPSAQRLIDHTAQAGPPASANRSAASARAAGGDPWIQLGPPRRLPPPPMQR